jgi:lysophospholipase L1-like esterase
MILPLCLSLLLLVQPQQSCAAAAAAADPPAGAKADLPTQAAKPSIIAVGDGLTEGAFARKHDGWGLLMQERYVRKVSQPGGSTTAVGFW